MLLGQFPCGGREVVIGDHHGVRAVVHRCAGHHLLHRTRADRPGLPLALDGKAIRSPSDDEVDPEVARERRHDHRGSTGAGDACDVVLELDARHGLLGRCGLFTRCRDARAA